MKANTCEEFVLGYVEQLERERDKLEDEAKAKDSTIEYANKIMGIIKQVIKIEKRSVREGEGEEAHEAWVLVPLTQGVKLNLEDANDRGVFVLMTPIVGDDEAKGELEKMRDTKAEAKDEAKAE